MIDPRYYGLIELVLVMALVLGFGIWQLRSVNRALEQSRREADKKEPPPEG